MNSNSAVQLEHDRCEERLNQTAKTHAECRQSLIFLTGQVAALSQIRDIYLARIEVLERQVEQLCLASSNEVAEGLAQYMQTNEGAVATALLNLVKAAV